MKSEHKIHSESKGYDGEHSPYISKLHNGVMTLETALEWILDYLEKRNYLKNLCSISHQNSRIIFDCTYYDYIITTKEILPKFFDGIVPKKETPDYILEDIKRNPSIIEMFSEKTKLALGLTERSINEQSTLLCKFPNIKKRYRK